MNNKGILWILVLIISLLVGASLIFVLSNNSGRQDNLSDDNSSIFPLFIPGIWFCIFFPILIANQKKQEEEKSKRSLRHADSINEQMYYTRVSEPNYARPALKYCSNCAAAHEPDSHFCTECGSRLD